MIEEIKMQTNVVSSISVDPIKFIETLLEREIGTSGCVYKKHDKYFRVIKPEREFDTSRGYFPWQDEHSLTEHQYKYILALQEVLQYLNCCYAMFDDGSSVTK